MTKYKSKWGILGVNKKQLKKIYEKSRVKAYTLLKTKYSREYSIILNNLMFKEYKKRVIFKEMKFNKVKSLQGGKLKWEEQQK